MDKKRKNKIKLFYNLLLVVIISVSPINVFAASGKTTLTCSKTTAKPGEKISCTLTGSADFGVSAISSKITASSGITLNDDIVVDSIWEGDDDYNLELYTADNKTGTFNIASFTVTISQSMQSGSTGTIKVGSTKFYDNKYAENPVSDTSISIQIASNESNESTKSTVNTLSALTLSKGTLSPSFSSNVTNYTATTTEKSLTISATATDSKAKITGNIGKVDIQVGTNNFKIYVTSESGTTKTYTISIIRTSNDSGDTGDSDNSGDLGETGENNDNDNNDSGGLGNETSLSLSLNKANDTSIILSVNVDNLSENDTAYCEVILIPEGGTGYQSGESKVVGKIDNCQNGKNLVTISDLSPNTKYTFQVVLYPTLSNMTLGESYVTFSTTSKSPIEDVFDAVTNPTTGSLMVYIICGILIISIVVCIYYFKFYQKITKEEKNEKK